MRTLIRSDEIAPKHRQKNKQTNIHNFTIFNRINSSPTPLSWSDSAMNFSTKSFLHLELKLFRIYFNIFMINGKLHSDKWNWFRFTNLDRIQHRNLVFYFHIHRDTIDRFFNFKWVCMKLMTPILFPLYMWVKWEWLSLTMMMCCIVNVFFFVVVEKQWTGNECVKKVPIGSVVSQSHTL